MVALVHEGGATPTMIGEAIPGRFLAVDGSLEGDELEAAVLDTYPNADLRRWFLDSPIHHSSQTWIVSNQWGTRTEAALTSLVSLVPNAGISYERA